MSKHYEEASQPLVVLDNVNATFEAGQFIVLLGKSGSGKSTLLNLISGIDSPTGGEIWVNGRVLTRLSDRERTLFRRDHTGFVFQFFNLIPTLNVLENVLLPMELGGQDGAAARKVATALLNRVGLASRQDTFPSPDGPLPCSAGRPHGAGESAARRMTAHRGPLLIVVSAIVAGLALAGWVLARPPQEAEIVAELVGLRPDGSTEGFAKALVPRTFEFPADHGPHPEYQTERWYYTGNLETGR